MEDGGFHKLTSQVLIKSLLPIDRAGNASLVQVLAVDSA